MGVTLTPPKPRRRYAKCIIPDPDVDRAMRIVRRLLLRESVEQPEHVYAMRAGLKFGKKE